MDKTNFMNEAKRMCSTIGRCDKCPAYDDDLLSCKICLCDEYSAEEKISIVEKWAKEHPIKTRQSVFLEQYPEAKLDEFGILKICPIYISSDDRKSDENCKNLEKRCVDCRREFWMQEVE